MDCPLISNRFLFFNNPDYWRMRMPDLKVYGPKIKDIETKRELVKEITDAMEKAYKFPRQAYVVTIFENLPENVSVGGILGIDKNK